MGNQSEKQAIILFDGVCNFCNGWVQFVINRDPEAYFQFASLQSEVATSLLAKNKIDHVSLDSIVLIEDGNVYTQSSAVLRICRRMKGFWRLLYAFILVPRPIRDFMYKVFAKNRYRLFGRKDHCMLPTPDIRKRFLEISPDNV